MIKVFLITGFLGAGKTTLLKNLLTRDNDKIGLIINEFGKTGFDGPLLKSSGTEMIELNNGSIFCSCLEPQFIESLAKMLNKPLKTIFVESSGLSDPGKMGKSLEKASLISGIEVELGGIITVVDLTRIVQLIDAFPVIQRQIEVADLIVANKSDIIFEKKLERTLAFIRKLNPKTNITVSSYCNLKPDMIFTVTSKLSKNDYENLDLPKKRQKKIQIEFKEITDYEKLKSFVEEIAPYSLRIKGTAITSKGNQRIDCVESDVRFYPLASVLEKSEMVMIFDQYSPVLGRIKESWNERFTTEFFMS